MDHIQFPYRSSSHLALMHVVNDCGAWDRQNLKVDYDKKISRSDAHKLIPSGEVEFTSGNHVSTYAARVRGDNWVYLGQSVSENRICLVTREDTGIKKIQDIKGHKFGTKGRHPGLNDWLYLKQRGLDMDRDEVEIINQIHHKKNDMDPSNKADPEGLSLPPLWQLIKEGDIDAALLNPPASLFAKSAGLRVIDIEPMPMIWFTTISSSLDFVEKHPDIVERFLKGIMEGVHFFKTRPEETIDIIEKRYLKEGKMDRAMAAITYDGIAPMLEPKLFPSMRAISNVYEEGVRQDKDALKINPMELWDIHHLRRIDDSGFVAKLYGNRR